MNLALWKKAISDAWLQLLVSVVVLVLFGWVFVWMMSQFPQGGFGMILRWLPNWLEELFGVGISDLATPIGQLSLVFIHAITMLVCIGWAVGRGSDPISGEIGRGTLDLILSLPLRRASILLAPAVVAAMGAAILAAALLAGLRLGLATIDYDDNISLRQLLPGAINLFCVVVFLTGTASFFSSWNRSRWRVISMTAMYYIISVIIETVARLWKGPLWEGRPWECVPGDWLRYLSFSGCFQPHRLVIESKETGLFAWSYNLPLLGLALLAYLLAAVILSYRDVPAAR